MSKKSSAKTKSPKSLKRKKSAALQLKAAERLAAEQAAIMKAQRNAVRFSGEDITILEKAIYHSYKMMFTGDETKKSNIFFEGKPVKPITGVADLKELFKKIIDTYATI